MTVASSVARSIARSVASSPIRGGGSVPAIPANSIALVVRTTAPSETFTLPLIDNGTENFTIDWGDGNVETGFATHDDARLVHTYTVAGDYTMIITGVNCRIFFNNAGDRLKVREILSLNLDAFGITNAAQMFNGCSNIQSTAGITASSVTAGDRMFQSCTALTVTPDLSSFTGLLSGFAMFNGCSNVATLPNLSNLTAMTNGQSMFVSCTGLTGTPNLTNLTALVTGTSMFNGCTNITGLVVVGASFPVCLNWTGTITSTGISAASVDEWLIAIDLTGPAAGTRTIQYQAMTGSAQLDSNRSVVGLAAINSLISKGWVRVGTY